MVGLDITRSILVIEFGEITWKDKTVCLKGCEDAMFRPEVVLSMDELNLDQAPQDINKEEFQLERVRLQYFVSAGFKKGFIWSRL
ncbi:hypothetical protein TNCV_2776241 [Trichonephila clavipes]|nr:hypothetical protein TNCV_2776241 [Trichonephila clavipes]